MENRLLGKWVVDPQSKETRERYGNASFEFLPNGDLVYSIDTGKSEQKILLTYKVFDGFMITDQKSSPKKIRTEYLINEKADRLVLINDDFKSYFVRSI